MYNFFYEKVQYPCKTTTLVWLGKLKSMNVVLDKDCVALHISCDWTSDAKAIKQVLILPTA